MTKDNALEDFAEIIRHVLRRRVIVACDAVCGRRHLRRLAFDCRVSTKGRAVDLTNGILQSVLNRGIVRCPEAHGLHRHLLDGKGRGDESKRKETGDELHDAPYHATVLEEPRFTIGVSPSQIE